MNLERTYEAYIACLNARDLSRLGEYVGDDVIYNGTEIGLHGYREMAGSRGLPQIIVQDKNGIFDFAALRAAIDREPHRLVLFAFDLLFLNGQDFGVCR